MRADIVSRERAVMGLESRAVSARVTKHFVTILVKHVINNKKNAIPWGAILSKEQITTIKKITVKIINCPICSFI